jgi:hypothetical protein
MPIHVRGQRALGNETHLQGKAEQLIHENVAGTDPQSIYWNRRLISSYQTKFPKGQRMPAER